MRAGRPLAGGHARRSGRCRRETSSRRNCRPSSPRSARATRATSAARPPIARPGAARRSKSTFAIARSSGCRSRPCSVEPSIDLLDRSGRCRAAVASGCRKFTVRADGVEYPGIRHDLAAAFGDALLRAACAFLDDGKTRRRIIIARSAGAPISPPRSRPIEGSTGSRAASISCCRFRRSTRRRHSTASLPPARMKPPHFHYRPLTVDPDLAKRELYSIDLDALEDPMLEQLLGEKRRELDAQLTMLATRNTPAFRPASMFLYGSVERNLLADARAILAASSQEPAARDNRSTHPKSPRPRGRWSDAMRRPIPPSPRHPGARRRRRACWSRAGSC